MSSNEIIFPRYEELYVVSDLHLGGTAGIRIFKQGKKLASLISHLAAREPEGGGLLTLALNGDVIDTLAERMEGYMAYPDEAVRILHDVMNHPDFAPVWQALRGFVGRPKHRLLVMIGNHDLELAYPHVQEQMLRELAGDDEAARGRVVFSTMGVGHTCRVGPDDARAMKVVCLHGNEFDSWNAVDPESMARIVRASCLGMRSLLPEDPPNAGTQLVKRVMNDVKREFPFVDLLKPEIETVFNVLMAVDPGTLKKVPGIVSAVTSSSTTGARRVDRVLGQAGDDDDVKAASGPTLSWSKGESFGKFLDESSGGGESMLDRAWSGAEAASTPEESADEVLGLRDMLGTTVRYWVRRITSEPKEALRTALLDWIGNDNTWDLDGPDDLADQLGKLGIAADVVIAGHTHLRRQKMIGGRTLRSQALYLNTGTWARLMKLQRSSLEPGAFESLWRALTAGTMEALDALGPDTLMNQGTVGVVRFDATQDAVVAAVCEKLDEDPVAAPLPVLRDVGNKPVWTSVSRSA